MFAKSYASKLREEFTEPLNGAADTLAEEGERGALSGYISNIYCVSSSLNN